MRVKQKIIIFLTIAATAIMGMTVFAESSNSVLGAADSGRATESNAVISDQEGVYENTVGETVLVESNNIKDSLRQPRYPYPYYGNYNNEFEYRRDSSQITITNWIATSSNAVVVVPDNIDGIPVVAIEESDPNFYIEKLVLPDTVYLNGRTFRGFTALKEINIPKVADINDYAFEGCINLERVQFHLESDIMMIGAMAFWGCDSLEQISLPNSLQYGLRGDNSFTSKNIKNIYVQDGGNRYFDIDGVLCMNGWWSSDISIISIPSGRTGEYTIPAEVKRMEYDAIPTFKLNKIIVKNKDFIVQGLWEDNENLNDRLLEGMYHPIIVCYRNSEIAKFAIEHGLPYEFIGETASSGRGGSSSSGSRTTSSVIKETIGTWIQDETGWWLKKNDSTYPKNEWSFIDKKWYYFNSTGYMCSGWQLLNDKWYYLTNDGEMVIGWLQHPDGRWYYMDASGAMLSDTITPDNFQVGSNGVWVQ